MIFKELKFISSFLLVAFVSEMAFASSLDAPLASSLPVAERNEPHGEMTRSAADEVVDIADHTTSTDMVFFSSRDLSVDDTGKTLLRRHAGRLKEDANLVLTLIGYARRLGSTSYGLAVAEDCINSVEAILRSLGVPRHQIRKVNAGGVTAARTCTTLACRQYLRRVELVYAQEASKIIAIK